MRKKRLWQVFLLFLLAGIVYACMMDDELFSSKMSLPPEVSGAKAWYESRVTNGELPWKSANGERENIFTPDWKKAFSNEDADYRVTEVHLEGDEKFIFISPECSEKFQETGDDRYMASDIRLVIRTDKKTNATDGFIMMLFPDLSYVEANKDHPLKDFSYLKRPPDFSGAIFYHNMEGDFVKGCKYEEGTAYTLSLNVEPDETDGPQLRYYNCTEFCTTTYYYTDVYVNGDYCYTTYIGSSYDCYYANCYWVDDGWNNPGGGGGGSGSGNSNGNGICNSIGNSNDPLGINYTPKAGDKFAKSNIPTTMGTNQSQIANTCVFSALSYLMTIHGSEKNQGAFMLDYLQKYNISFTDFNGVSFVNFAPFVQVYFNTLSISSYESLITAINAGYTVIAPNYDSNGDGHAIVIVGYHPDSGAVIFMDPLTGNLRESHEDYPITIDNPLAITSIKNNN